MSIAAASSETISKRRSIFHPDREIILPEILEKAPEDSNSFEISINEIMSGIASTLI